MQLFLRIVFLALVVSACGSEQEHETTANSDTTDFVPSEIPLTNPQDELLEVDVAFDANIAAFPKHWVEISIKGKDRIYTEYCNMEHPYVKLEKADSSWQIETFYGKDGELWNVMNMTANKQSAEGQHFQEGIFVVTKATYPDNEIYEVSYFWNQTAGFCSFGEFFDKKTRFADHALKDLFVMKKEICD